MKTIEKTGATVDAAIESALKELGCGKDDVEIEVLSVGKRGFLGLLGGVEARVRLTLKEAEPEEEKIDVKAILRADEKPKKSQGHREAARPIDIEGEDFSYVSDYLEDVLTNMGLNAEVSLTKGEENIEIDISGDMMGVVIGRRGDTLDALQYLCSLVLNKNRDEYIRVNLDTENYRQKREETLVNLAKRIASSVQRTGRSITLEPMNPNERRIIHSTLQAYEDINTFSIGEDPNRKIVVALKGASRRPRGGYRRNYSSSSSYKGRESASESYSSENK